MPGSDTAAERDTELSEARAREARLRARIAELEDELGRGEGVRRSTSRRRRDDDDDEEPTERARDIGSRGIDEISRLFRGIALASVEAVRATADAVGTSARRVEEKNREDDDDDTPRHLAAKLPGNVVDGILDGIDAVLDVPDRAVDKLRDTYHEGRNTRDSGRSGRRRTERDSDRESDRIRRALGRPVTRVILDAEDRVILEVGATITNESIRASRAAGALDMLLDSVSMRDPTVAVEQRVSGEQDVASKPES